MNSVQNRNTKWRIYLGRFLIYCAAGSGGLFLTSVFANLLGITVQPIFSSSGNSHDLGKGAWEGHGHDICFCGDYWELNYQPGATIYYTHSGNMKKFKQENPNVKIVLVDIDEEDYRKVTELLVCKAWPDILRDQPGEYEKWKGPDWPDWEYDIIQKNEMVKNELIDAFLPQIADWMKNYNRDVVDAKINFKSIMGIRGNLAKECGEIANRPVSQTVINLIQEYQDINRKLYFAD